MAERMLQGQFDAIKALEQDMVNLGKMVNPIRELGTEVGRIR